MNERWSSEANGNVPGEFWPWFRWSLLLVSLVLAACSKPVVHARPSPRSLEVRAKTR